MDVARSDNLYAVIACVEDRESTLATMLDSLAAVQLPLIIVDSSGGNRVAEMVPAWMRQHPSSTVHCISGPSRRALRAGFAEMKKLGFTHAITFGDGPVADPGNLPALLKSAAANPSALILGCRSDPPSPSLFGRLSDLLLQLESGLRLRDPRCPLRIYPLRLIDTISPGGRRNPSEMEILARAAWVGCPVIELLLPAIPAMDRDMHPRDRMRWPFAMRTLLLQSCTHIRLVARALSGWPHPKYDPSIVAALRPPFWRSIWQWCNPLRAWRELRQGGAAGRGEMAAGIAVGVFIANTPVYGFQTVLGLYIARRLHLHPVAVVAGSKASMPPIGPLLIAAAIYVGHFLLHGSIPRWKNITPFAGNFFAHAGPILLDWMVGALLVGMVTATVAFIVANFLFRFVEREKPGVLDAVDASGESGSGAVVLEHDRRIDSPV